MLNNLKKIIESTPQELALLPSCSDKSLENFKNGRLAYFRNDLETLNKSLTFFDSSSSCEFNIIVTKIFNLRLKIRANTLTISDLNEFGGLKPQSNDLIHKVLYAEYYSVLAIACDLLKDFKRSYSENMKSFDFSKEVGLEKKASIVFYNSIVAQNHQNRKSQRLHKLNDSIKLALNCDDFTTAIAAFNSLSNEYLALDCIELAYKEISTALDLAKNKLFGSFNHCFCLLAHADVCLSLNRTSLAKENLNILKAFDFKELKEKISLLEQKINKNTHLKASKLAGDEQKLIALLSTGPVSKYEIIEKIYGEGDFESFNNRFKQLVTRVKKKKGPIVNFNKIDSVYELIL